MLLQFKVTDKESHQQHYIIFKNLPSSLALRFFLHSLQNSQWKKKAFSQNSAKFETFYIFEDLVSKAHLISELFLTVLPLLLFAHIQIYAVVFFAPVSICNVIDKSKHMRIIEIIHVCF